MEELVLAERSEAAIGGGGSRPAPTVMAREDNATLQGGLQTRRIINLLYTQAKNLLVGGEFQWGQRKDFNLAAGDDMRFQFSVKYDFGTTFSL